MTDYSKLATEDFERILFDLVNQNPASFLLNIPGIYEIIAEDYNNEVLAHWKIEQE